MEYVIEGQLPLLTITITDKDGAAVDMSAKTVSFQLQKSNGDVENIIADSFTPPNIFVYQFVTAIEKVTDCPQETWNVLALVDNEPSQISYMQIFSKWNK